MEEPLPADRPRIFWKSKRRSANGRSLQPNPGKEGTGEANEQAQEESMKINDTAVTIATAYNDQPDPKANLTEKRKALFEPLEPINGKRSAAEMMLPPPDFEPASYPKGWLVGKKRKLVNVDVVESMRRIAIQEMNRKDREINGLNEQLEEDSRVLELLQKQLSDERKRRAEIEKENSMLHEQVSMLMSMLDENEGFGEEKLHHPIPSIKHHTVQLPVPAITDKKSQGTGFRVPLMSILFIIPFISISFYGLFTPSSCQFSQLQIENLREPVSECP